MIRLEKNNFIPRVEFFALFALNKDIPLKLKMSQAMRKCVLRHMQTTKVQIRLRIRAVWSAPLLFAA